MKEKFLAYLAEHPRATQAEAAQHFKVSRQRISQLCKTLGVKMMHAGMTRDWSQPVEGQSLLGRAITYKQGDCGSRGAAAELLVAVDLLDRGLHVFRAEAPNTPCDLIVLMGARALKVEVKSTSMRVNGKPSIPSTGLKGKSFDILALVIPGRGVEYAPRIEDWCNIP